MNEKIFKMSFNKIFNLLIDKAVRKNRTKDEVVIITSWLTGYSNEEINDLINSDITYGNFFLNAPLMNPRRKLIKGVICGYRVENIEDPLMQDMRYLDKLVDELAKGKTLDKILR